ncbi:MAG: LysM peptidoglycan-binding domain-containing protein [Nitrospirae bacterium]|nr:LysM peptidoglycan-binding domain-containing protein [Nitrospirota bacterium]
MKITHMKIRRRVRFFSLIAALVIFLNLANNVLAEENSPDNSEKTPYTIRKGDTLWDISEGHLKNPFLWPSIWEKNRYIKNPDLIYPGRLLVMPYGPFLKAPESGETEVPQGPPESEVESEVWSLVSAPAPASQEESSTPAPPPAPLEPISPPVPVSPPSPSVHRAVPQAVSPEPKAEAKASMAPASFSIISQRGRMTLTALADASGYITDSIENSGMITASPEEKVLFADGDNVTLLLKDKASVGDRFTIFQPPAPVSHPKTGKRVGMLFVPVGEIEITGVQGRDAEGRIIKSYTYSSQGDYIQPYRPSAPAAKSGKTVPDLSGYIIESHEGKMLNAEYSIVYLDRGASDGVIPGTTFYVIEEERHDVVGELRVISVQAATSTALVTKSVEPFDIGSKIVTLAK